MSNTYWFFSFLLVKNNAVECIFISQDMLWSPDHYKYRKIIEYLNTWIKDRTNNRCLKKIRLHFENLNVWKCKH